MQKHKPPVVDDGCVVDGCVVVGACVVGASVVGACVVGASVVGACVVVGARDVVDGVPVENGVGGEPSVGVCTVGVTVGPVVPVIVIREVDSVDVDVDGDWVPVDTVVTVVGACVVGACVVVDGVPVENRVGVEPSVVVLTVGVAVGSVVPVISVTREVGTSDVDFVVCTCVVVVGACVVGVWVSENVRRNIILPPNS